MIDLGLTDDDMKMTSVIKADPEITETGSEREVAVMVILIGTGNANDDTDDIETMKVNEKGMMSVVVSAEGGIITMTRLRKRGKNDVRDDVKGKNDIGTDLRMGMEEPLGIGTGLGNLIDHIIVRGNLDPTGVQESPGLSGVVVEREMMISQLFVK